MTDDEVIPPVAIIAMSDVSSVEGIHDKGFQNNNVDAQSCLF
jgi:hypothetical protein